MAQRNSPSRRIPGEPLAGVLRTVAYQARYANRRRADVPSVTNANAAAESAVAAASASTAAAVTRSEQRSWTNATQPQAAATPVAAVVEAPRNAAATVQVDENGRATWQFEGRGSVPHVVATAVADQPAVATVTERTATSATVAVWDLSGSPVAGAYVSVVAVWP